jgi:hypothetical protein
MVKQPSYFIKNCAAAMHNAALLAQENANLRMANEKKRQKRTRSNRQMAPEGGLSVEEGLQQAQQQNQPVESNQLVSPAQGGLPLQQDQRGLHQGVVDVGRLGTGLVHVKSLYLNQLMCFGCKALN